MPHVAPCHTNAYFEFACLSDAGISSVSYPFDEAKSSVRGAGFFPVGIRGADIKLTDTLGQRRGVFLVEFFWHKLYADGVSIGNYHVVAVICFRRLALRNTMGVVPCRCKRDCVESHAS